MAFSPGFVAPAGKRGHPPLAASEPGLRQLPAQCVEHIDLALCVKLKVDLQVEDRALSFRNLSLGGGAQAVAQTRMVLHPEVTRESARYWIAGPSLFRSAGAHSSKRAKEFPEPRSFHPDASPPD
jgi:hypothetical protein